MTSKGAKRSPAPAARPPCAPRPRAPRARATAPRVLAVLLLFWTAAGDAPPAHAASPAPSARPAARAAATAPSPATAPPRPGLLDEYRRALTPEVFEVRRVFETGKAIQSLCYTRDARLLVVGHADGAIELWREGAAQPDATLAGHRHSVTSLDVSPDNRLLVSGSEDRTIRVWDLRTRRETRRLGDETGFIYAVQFDPSGTQVLAGGSDIILHSLFAMFMRAIYREFVSPTVYLRLWDLRDGTEASSFVGPDDSVDSVRFSPDGRYFASGSLDHKVRVFSTEFGRQKHLLTGPADIAWSVAYSPDGRYLAAGFDDETIVWDAAKGDRVRSFKHRGGVGGAVAFLGDGGRLVRKIVEDVIAWDLGTGKELTHLFFHPFHDRLVAMAVSPDRRLVSLGTLDGRVIELSLRLPGAPSAETRPAPPRR